MKAIEYHQLHLGIAKEVGDKVGEGGAYTNLGIAYRNMGDFKTAIMYQRKHLIIAKEKGNKSGEGIAYSNLGIAYDCLGDFKKAIGYHEQHLTIAKEMGDKFGEGSACSNIGIAYRNLGDFKKSIEYQERHLTIAKEVGDRVGEGRVYAGLGRAYDSLGDFKKAIEYHQRHLTIAKSMGDKAGEGRANGNLGMAHHHLGDFEKALKYYDVDLNIAKEVGDRSGEGSAYGNFGLTYYSLGNFKKAIEYHRIHLNIAKELGAQVAEGGAYSNLGIAYFSLGDFDKAIEYIQRYVNIAKEVGDRSGEGRGYGNLGSAYMSLGEFQKAEEYHQLHLKIAQEVEDRAAEGGAYGNLGTVHHNLGNFEKAIEYHSLDLSIAKEVGDRSAEGRAYSDLGVVYHSLGDFKKAIQYHQLHVSIAKDLGARSQEGRAYANLGAAYDSLGDFEKAIEYHHLFLSISKETADVAREATAYCNLGNAHGSLGDLSKAEFFFQSSVELLDNLRSSLHSRDELKISLRNHYEGPYSALVMVLLQQNKITEALLTAERGRGRALMDLMEEQYGLTTHYPAGESSQHIGKMSHILSYISSPTVFLAVGQTTINFWILGKEFHFMRKQIDKKYAKENAFASLVSLNEDAYSRIGVFKSVKGEDRSLDEPTDEEVPANRPNKKGSMSQDCDDDPLRALYDLVIGPILDMIHGNEITIVPDGPLFLSPFAAFVDQHSKFLSETFTIRLIPTLSSLKVLTECPEGYHSTTGALLVGDPWVGSVRIAKKGQKKAKKQRLPQLPAAKIEVEMIGKIVKTEPLIGERATKEEVLRRISSVALVHIAAHGKAETGEIALSPNPTQSPGIPKEEDYLLKMEDVKNAKMQAKLVVLSCCHSGRGDIKSEGVVGIARAFLGAGARSVLASLWAISDEATQEFMSNFYNNLAKGLCASKCLNQAMKVMRESDRFGRVEHWAPFVLIGDDVTLDFGQAR